jgi:Zn-dependent peptidase ImmA (M78 family)
MKHEHFLRAALRSYQELQENYFQEIEDATVDFSQKYKLGSTLPVDFSKLRAIIETGFGYQLDETHLASDEALAYYRSIFLDGRPPRLFLNPSLQANQVKFIIARELGYQILGLKERANTSTPDRVDSFEQVLNDFKASYFAGSLLMPQQPILKDLTKFFQHTTWSPAALLAMLTKYDITPEMLFYRFSELLPQFFGIRIHFHRFHKNNGSYKLVKQLNMNRLLSPSGIALHEHHCRRWLALQSLHELANAPDQSHPLIKAQISEYYKTGDRFLSMGFARWLALDPNVGSSIVLGFQITPELGQTIRFLSDPSIPELIINETCERCPFSQQECELRSAEPSVLQAEEVLHARKSALHRLTKQAR